NLQPHRVEMFKLSRDPHFVSKLRDIVGLYLKPPAKALVLSVDEKSQIQALDRTQPILPLRPGCPRGRRMTTSGTARPHSLQPSAASKGTCASAVNRATPTPS